MGQTPAIEVEKLHVGYGSVAVLHGIDLAVAPGEFIAILGPSGCGKTTLLRTIAGFQKASDGAIRLSGRDVANLASARGTRRKRRPYPTLPSTVMCGQSA